VSHPTEEDRMTQDPSARPDGVLPGGDPDDVGEQSTPGSDGDGPEAGYTGSGDAAAEGDEEPEGHAPAGDR